MITLGADPEFFLYDQDYGNYGAVKPCVGIIPGTKESPHDLGDGYGVHEDNVMVELMVPPTSTIGSFASSIEIGKAAIQSACLTDKQVLQCYSAWEFYTRELNTKQAKTFGCEPDFDAYTSGKMRRVPRKLHNSNWRSAGGHVHLGGDFNCPNFVGALLADVFITLYSHLDTGNSTPTGSHGFTERTKWYGQPGIYRDTAYGFEYRTPNNLWCQDYLSSEIMGDRCMRLCYYLENNSATQIREAIRQINWLAIQELLSGINRTKAQTDIDEMYAIFDEVRNVLPV